MPDHIYKAEIVTQYPQRFTDFPTAIFDASGIVIGTITAMEKVGVL